MPLVTRPVGGPHQIVEAWPIDDGHQLLPLAEAVFAGQRVLGLLQRQIDCEQRFALEFAGTGQILTDASHGIIFTIGEGLAQLFGLLAKKFDICPSGQRK